MSDRVLVQNAVPLVDIPQEDGSTIPGIVIRGYFDVLSQAPTIVRATPVLDLAQYASADAMGGMLTFENATYDEDHLGVTIDSAVVSDLSKQSVQLDIVLFDRLFTPTDDNQPFDPTDSDLLNIVGVIEVRTADWSLFDDNGVAVLRNIGLNTVLAGVDLYAQLVCRGTVTFTEDDALQVTLGIRRD